MSSTLPESHESRESVQMFVGFMWFVVADRREHYYIRPQDGESARPRRSVQLPRVLALSRRVPGARAARLPRGPLACP
jgi:hypothetical protein